MTGWVLACSWQVVARLVGEIVLCTKEVNQKTRAAAYALLVGLGQAMHEAAPPPGPDLDARMGGLGLHPGDARKGGLNLLPGDARHGRARPAAGRHCWALAPHQMLSWLFLRGPHKMCVGEVGADDGPWLLACCAPACSEQAWAACHELNHVHIPLSGTAFA